MAELDAATAGLARRVCVVSWPAHWWRLSGRHSWGRRRRRRAVIVGRRRGGGHLGQRVPGAGARWVCWRMCRVTFASYNLARVSISNAKTCVACRNLRQHAHVEAILRRDRPAIESLHIELPEIQEETSWIEGNHYLLSPNELADRAAVVRTQKRRSAGVPKRCMWYTRAC